MKKLISIITILVVITSLFIGCSQSNSKQTENKEGTNENKESVENIDRNDLVVALSAAFSNLDPFETSVSEQVRFNYMVFDRLYTYVSTEAILEPMLATEYEISEDGLTWTFKLRDDVVFHDKTKMTANDVKASFEKAIESPYKGSSLKMIKEVKVVDNTTVEFVMNYYYSASLEAISGVVIVPESLYEGKSSEAFNSEFIGSGPFKLSTIDSATGNIELVRNDDYWGGKSELEKLSFRVIGDPSTRVVSLENGEVDFCEFASTDYDTISKNENLQIVKTVSSSYPLFVFNTEKEPTSDVKFRQAIAYALDYESINAIANGSAPSEINTVLYKDFYGLVPEGVKEYEYNPDKARELLIETGISLPYDLGVMQTTSRNKSICETIQQNLREIGIEIEVEVAEQGAYINNVLSGNYLLLFMPGSQPGLDPVSELYAFLSEEKIGSSNLGRYKNTEVEELLKELALSKDEEEKADYIQKIVEIAQEEIPVIKLYDNDDLSACNADLNIEVVLGNMYNFSKFSWK